MKLLADDCGLALVLEDVRALDAALDGLGLGACSVDVMHIASVGRKYRHARQQMSMFSCAESDKANSPVRSSAPPIGFQLVWLRARQMHVETEVEMRQRLRAVERKLAVLTAAGRWGF